LLLIKVLWSLLYKHTRSCSPTGVKPTHPSGMHSTRAIRTPPARKACHGRRPKRQRSEQQRARAGAEIEDRRRRAAREMINRRLDQRLAVGARDQHARTDRKLDRPECAGAGDVRDRLMREATRDERDERIGSGVVEMAEQDLLARHAERVRHQQFGVETGGVGYGGELPGASREREADQILPGTGRGTSRRLVGGGRPARPRSRRGGGRRRQRRTPP